MEKNTRKIREILWMASKLNTQELSGDVDRMHTNREKDWQSFLKTKSLLKDILFLKWQC